MLTLSVGEVLMGPGLRAAESDVVWPTRSRHVFGAARKQARGNCIADFCR